ncbi:hypothetical protein ACFFF7_04635 [Novosphingobium aquiterrae]|uniref:Inner membrane protein n=1 Tax=Novosphingobium aquiterrae TaxID=624388 RepID=A0ABV6PFT6_9SPHN
MTQQAGQQRGNWAIVLLIALGLAAMTLILAAGAPDTTEAIRVVIRATARTSLVLFMAAFCASGLVALTSAPAALWLRRNRRQIGVGFALSHLLHAAALVALARRDPALFDTLTTPASFIFGGAAYVVIVAMLATSFDATARAIGPVTWRRLHTTGVWFIWLMFLINFGKRIPAHPSYALAIMLAFTALVVRVIGGRKNKAGLNRPAATVG